MMNRTYRALLSALAITVTVTGCEQALLHDPAPASTMLGLQFSLNSSAANAGRAYDKATAVRVAIFRAADFRSVQENLSANFTPIGAMLDTSEDFAPAAENRVQVEIDLENAVEPLVVVGALMQGGSPLFAGITTIQARRGEVNAAPVDLIPIPNRINLTSPPTLTALNETANLNAVVLFASGDTIPNASVTFSSSNNNVATVDGTGRITARGDGQAQVTATSTVQSFSISQVVNVTVTIAVASITVTPSPITMDVGTTQQLVPTARDRLNNVLTGRTFTYSSSASSVASVNAAGLVSGVAAGTAIITVRSGTASQNVNVTVQERPIIGLSRTDVPMTAAIGAADPAAELVTITNAGSGSLTGISLDAPIYLGTVNGWLTATLSGTTAPATVTLRATRGNLGVGTHVAEVRVRANAQNSPQVITVRFIVTGVQITGRVIDASRGQGAPIPGASVTAIAGQGPPITAVTNADGRYTLSVAAGVTYRVTASAQGFIDQSSTITTTSGPNVLDFALSPVLQQGQYRIVLTWGQSPVDLDSHLFGPLPEQEARFQIYFGNLGSLTSSPFAALDVDDTDSFGPETITIAQQLPGFYTYSVHNFSGETPIASSGAIVRVYHGTALVAEFTPPNQQGIVWNVFSISSEGVSPIQTIGSDFAGSIALPDHVVGLRRYLDDAQRLIIEAGQKYQKSKR